MSGVNSRMLRIEIILFRAFLFKCAIIKMCLWDDKICETIELPDGDQLTIELKDDGINYRNNNHRNKISQKLDDMRNQELFCDVILVADHSEVPAHKIILATASLFFYTMLSGIFAVSTDRLVLDGVHRFALPEIIKYIYTGEILITEDNVGYLLRAANKLSIKDVFSACLHFLQTQLNSRNCIRIAALAEEFHCTELLNEANYFIQEHFLEFVESKDFLDIPQQQLCTIIKSDKLNAPDEFKVFKAVLSWIKHDCLKRCKYLATLMEFVRFPLMSQEDLIDNVAEEPLFETNIHCMRLLKEAVKFHFTKGDKGTILSNTRTKTRGRQPVLVVVGETNNGVLSMEIYDFDEQRWFKGPKSFRRPKRNGSCLLIAEEKVYMIGGSNYEGCLVDVFDLNDQKWVEYTNLLESRRLAAATILDGDIYVTGGDDDEDCLASCEKLDRETGCWIRIADMLEGRYGHNVCSLDGKMYAMGGFNENSTLSSVECYSPITNTWECVPDMSISRSYPGVASLDGRLYVFRGFNKSFGGYLKSAEYYDLVDQRWTRLVGFQLAKGTSPGVIAINGLIYIIGGYDGETALDSVKVYDPNLKTMALLPNHMIEGKKGISAAVIKRYKNK